LTIVILYSFSYPITFNYTLVSWPWRHLGSVVKVYFYKHWMSVFNSGVSDKRTLKFLSNPVYDIPCASLWV